MAPKSRFSATDVRRMTAEVNRLLRGGWCQNIYSMGEDNKTFLFKLTGRGDKYTLLLESGVRFHPTEYLREKSDQPSPFAMKLRKHLRERRLEYVKQLGLDRVVDFCFVKGTETHHLILELYAAGNLVLTNDVGVILALLRPYTLEDDARRVAVGAKYPLDVPLERLTADLPMQIATFLTEFAKQQESSHQQEASVAAAATTAPSTITTAKPKKPVTVKGAVEKPRPSKPQKKEKDRDYQRELAQCLASKGSPVQGFGPKLVEHVLVLANIDPHVEVTETTAQESDKMAQALVQGERILDDLANPDYVLPGYVLRDRKDHYYSGFEAIKFVTKSGDNDDDEFMEFPSFCDAVDDFFFKVEEQQDEKRKATIEKSAMAKVDGVRKDQAERVKKLLNSVEERETQARVLSERVLDVDNAINAVNSLLGSGMSWEDVETVVKQEKRMNNPVASLIRALKLNDNKITLQLDEGVVIDVDLSLSAQANVSKMFQDKKHAQAKAEMTIQKATAALEDMSKKELKVAAKLTAKAHVVRLAPKPMWFEKFHWFITSEGILVLGGKDAHQNELLVKRFLRRGDAYLHADQHGAPSCVVRNPVRDITALPVESLRQAGMFCVCRSSAWQAKVVTSAWWVESHQVSKSAPTGEFLGVGSFMIRGKKNYLQPTRLEMSFGYIFKVDVGAREKEGGGEDDEDGNKEEESERMEWRYLKRPEELKGLATESSEAATASSSLVEKGHELDDHETNPIVNELLTGKMSSSTDGVGMKKSMVQSQAKKTPKTSQSTTTTKAQPTTVGGEPISNTTLRAKQRKQKLASQKYKDQSEEDRALAMLALGSQGKSVNTNTGVNDVVRVEDDAGGAMEKVEEAGKSDGNLVVEKEKMVKEEEGDDDHDDNEAQDGGGENVLVNFTAAPREEDSILYAVPFCGPVAATDHFKFRVKLTPGTLKKGKAAKQAVDLFTSRANKGETEAITSVTEPQNVAVMMGETKVTAPGLDKVVDKALREKKLAAAKRKKEAQVAAAIAASSAANLSDNDD